jgi:5-methylcytosine-specific restriction endonuclease McrA
MGVSNYLPSSRTKTCPDCNIEKNEHEYTIRKSGKLASYCKDCNATRTANYRKNNRERYLLLKKENRLRNPQKVREESIKRYRNNLEKEKARYAAYYETHKHDIVENGRRRRTRLLNAPTFVVSKKEWNRLCARYHWCCAYCGEKSRLTQDHVIPLFRGGYHGIGNLLPACQSCNSSKNKKFIVEWKKVSCAD